MMTETEALKLFDEWLDDFGPYRLFASVIFPSAILKNCDNTAYRTYFNDWLDLQDIELTNEKELT